MKSLNIFVNVCVSVPEGGLGDIAIENRTRRKGILEQLGILKNFKAKYLQDE